MTEQGGRPRVTVVTPSYNQAEYLGAALDSVLGQDYPDIEYIVVDGGSTDGSADVIRRYEARLAWWVSEPDRGQSDAINKGFARATGDVVAWLNSDDVYLPGAVSAAVAALKRHPEAGMVYAGAYGLDPAGNVTDLQRYGQYGLLDLLCMRIIPQPAVFMRREAFEEAGGLRADFHMLMDHHLWCRIARRRPLVYVDAVWAGMRRHAEAKNTARRPEFGAEARKLLAGLSEEPDLAPLFARHRRAIAAGLDIFEAVYLLGDGRDREALRRLVRAVAVSPACLGRAWRLLVLAAAKSFGPPGAEDLLYRLRGRKKVV